MPVNRTVAAGIAALSLFFASCDTTKTSVQTDGSKSAAATPASATRSSTNAGIVGIRTERRWTLFQQDSKEFADWQNTKDLAKSVTRIGAGPEGATIIAPDATTLDLFTKSAPGFVIQYVDRRLWVVKEGSPELKTYLEKGIPDKRTTVMGRKGIQQTMMAVDTQTIDAFAAFAPKLDPVLLNGKIWLLR